VTQSHDAVEELSRVHEYQRLLAAFARIASEALSPDRLLQVATAHISGVTHIGHVKILKYRRERGDLLVSAGVGWKPGVVGNAILHVDNASPAGRSIQTGAPVVIEDLPNDPEYRYAGILRDHGIVSLINVPVMIDGRIWGVLEIDSSEIRQFRDSDVAFLTAFSNILAIGLKTNETEAKAAATLDQHGRAQARWETLAAELRHRVRNNFQTIIGFLTIQRRHADTADSRERFSSVIDRVHAIALAHDQLSMKADASDVKFADYLRALCANIDPHREQVTIVVEATETTLPLDRAVPAGLIVNELVSNAFKYAFEAGMIGVIRVLFTVAPERGEASLVVEDNGKGMGPPREGGLGLRLVDALAGQLSGRVWQDSIEKGTQVRVTFPLPR
jgi:two-component sensor histidine kinase